MKKTALFLFTFFFLAPSLTMAQEVLRFHKAASYKEKQIISFIKKANKAAETPYLIAVTDLNNDAINEYITKPASPQYCPNNSLCPHQISAFQDNIPIALGKFDAHKMLISNKKDYGVRHIIVYNVPYNDFKYKTATWSPFNFRFELP